jgi:hypothetical protein
MRRASRFALAFALAGLVAIGCGDNVRVAPDAGADAAIPTGRCGNEIVEPGEDCDDGDTETDLVCDSACQFTCGNGVVDDGETCDPGIGGSCPDACDDERACTSDILAGSGCQAECVFAEITVNQDDDGCCVDGATSIDDSDCPVECGNGVVEAGEACDTAIAAGQPGACPTACSDDLDCTEDRLVGAGTCGARCTFSEITEPSDGDGCCPTGANSGNDTDCPPGCDNGVVDPGETCDTAIPAGDPGACPTSCPADADACTTEVLVSGGTCVAACASVPVVEAIDGDGCCPPGANANTDDDCEPVCGNQVVEPGEQCDDGDDDPTDGCDRCQVVVTPTAFRFTDLDLRDPHTYVQLLGCRDATDVPVFGLFAVNTELQTALTTDGDGDGDLDLSPVNVFRPFDQGAPTHPIEVHFASCSASTPITCSPGADPPVTSTATNATAGTCLAPLAGTTSGYSPAITSSSAPCFASGSATLTIELSGIPITLRDAQVAATYLGNPATGMVNGLIRGFISEADANATILPASLPLVGGQPLSRLLPGGQGNCRTNAGFDDRDFNGPTRGWWFYLNYTATRTPWTEP